MDTPTPSEMDNRDHEIATLGAGCFWCVEAVFARLEGVLSVVSGYMGGQVEDPSYEDVCRGTTGHAEVAQITFDATRISFAELLDVFWKMHDPTTLNRQGADHGTQYRSAIFYHTDKQREIALESRRNLDASNAYPDPVVTEISPAQTLYEAEMYHQDYYKLNPNAPYCQYVIHPKLLKLGMEA